MRKSNRDTILVWMDWFRLAHSSELSCPRVFMARVLPTDYKGPTIEISNV